MIRQCFAPLRYPKLVVQLLTHVYNCQAQLMEHNMLATHHPLLIPLRKHRAELLKDDPSHAWTARKLTFDELDGGLQRAAQSSRDARAGGVGGCLPCMSCVTQRRKKHVSGASSNV